MAGTSSLFDAKNLKNIDDTIHVKPYLENLPETPAEVGAGAGRRDPQSAGAGQPDLGRRPDPGDQCLSAARFERDANFDREITAAIERRSRRCASTSTTVYQVGVAAMRSDLTGKIRADQRVFLPLSVLVLLLTLAFSLRRATAVVMPLATAGISVLWTLGFMGWLGIPVNIMTSIVPALVIIIGSTEDIHLLAEYAAGVRDGLDRRDGDRAHGRQHGRGGAADLRHHLPGLPVDRAERYPAALSVRPGGLDRAAVQLRDHRGAGAGDAWLARAPRERRHRARPGPDLVPALGGQPAAGRPSGIA